MESQAVLDSIKENDFHGVSAEWKNDAITVYVPKEIILKETAAKLSKLSQRFFFDLVRELSDWFRHSEVNGGIYRQTHIAWRPHKRT
jgi:hypothetical protein